MNTIALKLLDMLMSYFLGRLWIIAKAAVSVAQDMNWTSDQKRQEALKFLRNEVGTVGVALSSSLQNLAIEAAVQLLKSGKL
jgi:hypothetical protein